MLALAARALVAAWAARSSRSPRARPRRAGADEPSARHPRSAAHHQVALRRHLTAVQALQGELVRIQQRVGFGSALPQLPVHVLDIWRPSLVVRGAVEVRSAAKTSRWRKRLDSRRCTSAEREVVVRLGHLFTGCTASLSRVDAAAYQRAPEMLRDFQKELKSVNPVVQGLLSWSTICIASRATSFPVVDALRRGAGSSSRASAPHHQPRRRAARAVRDDLRAPGPSTLRGPATLHARFDAAVKRRPRGPRTGRAQCP
ncbi:hypothetical protein T492DRAFT_939895 [Pavlovales sp. CCMP2436]|nr:hypothetical protein T492DRAFT_939895 [Pavlovales sp. CCMP2436]